MSLSFLPEEIKNSIGHLNYNLITEIRIRKDRCVVIGYKDRYEYLGKNGISGGINDRIIPDDVSEVLSRATGGSVYNYTEQMRNGFITVEHGVRIGIAGEYVIERGTVNTIKNITSLNIRVPHDVYGCSDYICEELFSKKIYGTLIYSRPGLGKTTILRDLARKISSDKNRNVLILDERSEISAIDAMGEGFDLGNADIVRCYNKIGAAASAIRAMKPDVIITDELYGDDDLNAVKYISDCGIAIIASSHISDKEILKKMPFDYFAELTEIGGKPVLYDKNFNVISYNRTNDLDRHFYVGEQKKEDAGIR